MKYRQGIIKDYSAVKKLWIACNLYVDSFQNKKVINNRLKHDPDLFIVCEDSEKIAGVVLGGFDGRFGNFSHLAVHLDYRHKGIGKTLISKVEKILKKKGAVNCYVLAIPKNYYEKMGYNPSKKTVFLRKNL